MQFFDNYFGIYYSEIPYFLLFINKILKRSFILIFLGTFSFYLQGTLISLHDSDFSFRCNDSLSRRHNNLMRTFILALEMI